MSTVITSQELLQIIAECSRETPGMHKAIASMIDESDLSNLPADVIRTKIAEITFERRASTPYDDDEYWLAQSPFDGDWYLFASLPCAGWPTRPVRVLSDRLEFFDED